MRLQYFLSCLIFVIICSCGPKDQPLDLQGSWSGSWLDGKSVKVKISNATQSSANQSIFQIFQTDSWPYGSGTIDTENPSELTFNFLKSSHQLFGQNSEKYIFSADQQRDKNSLNLKLLSDQGLSQSNESIQETISWTRDSSPTQNTSDTSEKPIAPTRVYCQSSLADRWNFEVFSETFWGNFIHQSQDAEQIYFYGETIAVPATAGESPGYLLRIVQSSGDLPASSFFRDSQKQNFKLVAMENEQTFQLNCNE